MSPLAPRPPPPSSDTPLHADHSTPSTVPTRGGECLNNSAGRGLVDPCWWGWAGEPVDDAALEEVARVREALRGDLGEPLCGHLTGQRWTGCTPESLRCWIIR
jgi:hypothetical protein